MKCADPVLCYTNEKGKRIFRHFSQASHIFKFYQHQQVFSCGKCIFCRKKKAYELASRCVLHASLYKQNCFLTLTYDEKKENYHNELQYEDIQKFKKRLRSYCSRTFNKKIQVFNVHEYGKNGKKHWHLIIFNHDFDDKSKYVDTAAGPLYISEKLKKLWPYGHHTIGDVSLGTAMYQAQYMEKDFKNYNVTSKKKSKSNHSGLGKDFFLSHYKQILDLGYVPINGKKLPIPRYFQKLAHKHYSHFYEKENFFDTSQRKALYRPFKQGEENLELANLYIQYKSMKDEKIKELEMEWNTFLSEIKETKLVPEFVLSNENTLYDLRNKNNKEIF